MSGTVNVFLQLSAEFGGTKFGPFTGAEIRLGSDPAKNDIVLPESLGVLREHVKVIKQSNEAYVIAPTERTAAVFIWRADGRPPRQITTPISLGPRDGFSLVTAEGPKFLIIVELPPEKERPKPSTGMKKAAQGLSFKAFAEEIKRQGMARAMTTQVGVIYRQLNTFILSGAFLSPRNIIMMMTLSTGWLFGGGLACGGCYMRNMLTQKDTKIESLEGQVRMCQGNASEDPTVPMYVGQILGDPDWQKSLDADQKLRAAFIEELKLVFSAPEDYRWAYKKPASSVVALSQALTNSKMPAAVSRVLTYHAMGDGFVEEPRFLFYRKSSKGVESCGRGPAWLTYRQAKNLGLGNVLPDALVDTSLASGSDDEAKVKALTDQIAPDVYDANGQEILAEPLSGGRSCLTFVGDDERNDPTTFKTSLVRSLGKAGDRLPAETESYWTASRVMKFYAADWRTEDFETLKFDKRTIPTSAIEKFNDDQKSFATTMTAKTMARAVAVPCLLTLDKEMKGKDVKHIPERPTLMQCGMLSILLQQ